MAGNEDFIIFGSPDIREEEIREVEKTLRSGWLGTGPRTAQFEREFAEYIGAVHAVAVNSCTAALHLSLLAAGIGPEDEVITTAFTFPATVNAIIHSGAVPVLADIDPESLNLDPVDVRRKIGPSTRAILPVHFAGRACNMDALKEIAEERGLILIEDCAHAVETEYKGIHAGRFGDFGCFSFYVTKNVVTGEGGMIVAREEEHIDRLKRLALHGLSKDAWKRFSDEGYKHYFVVEPGFKYNMMDIQAALGIHQLRRVDEMWRRRQEVWNRYDATFSDLPVKLPSPPEENTRHGYHLYTLQLTEEAVERDVFLDRMTAAGIGVGVHYLSIPEHPYYRHSFGWHPDSFPSAFRAGRDIVSIPLSSKLSESQLSRIEAAVSKHVWP